MRFVIAILFSLLTAAQAQMGLSKADYEKIYGKCIDDGLPGPTGENWAIYEYHKYNCKVAVLFKNKKSIFVTFKRKSRFDVKEQKEIAQTFEKGNWESDGSPIPTHESPSKKLYYARFGGLNFALRAKNTITDTDHQYYQREFQLKRKPSFGTAYGKVADLGLGMKEKDLEKTFGRPITSWPNSKKYEKEGVKYRIYFDPKTKNSFRVEIRKGILISSKFLEEIKNKLSRRWTSKGDTLLSSDKRYVISIKLDQIDVISAKVASKLDNSFLAECAPTFQLGKW